jgi:hypothetical protein
MRFQLRLHGIVGRARGLREEELRCNSLIISLRRSPLAKEIDSEISALSLDIAAKIATAMVSDL